MLSRAVVYKHTNWALYSESSYNLAVLLGHLPLTLVSDFLFATILYWIAGYSSQPQRWLVFVLVIVLQDLAISVLYRSFSYSVRSEELAMIVSAVFIGVGECVLCESADRGRSGKPRLYIFVRNTAFRSPAPVSCRFD